jgi:hypothetical protein
LVAADDHDGAVSGVTSATATEPINRPVNPPRPRDPRTSSSARRVRSSNAVTADPLTSSAVTDSVGAASVTALTAAARVAFAVLTIEACNTSESTTSGR